MRLHRFFIDEHLRNKKDIAVYDDGIIHQWKNVFRLRTGDRIILLDNSGFEFLSEISLLAKGKAELKIIQSSQAENVVQKDIRLFPAVIKKDNLEWVLEKGTELGVSRFVPIVSDRSEKKGLNMERCKKILREASEQSERGFIPEIEEPATLKEAIDMAQKDGIPLIAFHGEGKAFKEGRKTGDRCGILIGPEGGWTNEEVEFFLSKDIPLYSLGKQILRAETAAIAAASLLLL
jgi:16S rRNA (uracil1498-N3)-methyltransferase